MMTQDFLPLAEQLGLRMQQLGWYLVLAESCTGGGIAQAVSDVPGSSAWFDRGFVTYSNASKIEILGVQPSTLNQHGAVSEETALEMVNGALSHSHAALALAVTGIAGPTGGSTEKPIGTVFIAWQLRDQPAQCVKKHFAGDRHSVRQQVIEYCLHQALNISQNALVTQASVPADRKTD